MQRDSSTERRVRLSPQVLAVKRASGSDTVLVRTLLALSAVGAGRAPLEVREAWVATTTTAVAYLPQSS